MSQDCGKVKKVRGLAYGFRVSPQLLNRIATAAKGTFLPYLSDVFVTADLVKNSRSKIPGFGLVLYAETTKNIHYAADGFIGREKSEEAESVSQVNVITSDLSHASEAKQKKKIDLFADEEEENEDGQQPKKKKKKTESGFMEGNGENSLKKKSDGGVLSPEELGEKIAKDLLRQIASRSCVDSTYQWLVLGLMALGPKDVSSVLLGPLTPFTIQFLRDLRTFLNVTFRVENFREERTGDGDDDDDAGDDDDERKGKLFKLSCLGSGYVNLNKTMV